jgi:hypothetical protein
MLGLVALFFNVFIRQMVIIDRFRPQRFRRLQCRSRNSLDLRTNFPASNASVHAPACSSVGSMPRSNPRMLLCRRFRGGYRFRSIGSEDSVALKEPTPSPLIQSESKYSIVCSKGLQTRFIASFSKITRLLALLRSCEGNQRPSSHP